MELQGVLGHTEEHFYQEYYKTAEYIFRMILPPIGSREDIEEGVQDVLLEVMNHPEKYDATRGGIKNYIRVIARSKAIFMKKRLMKKQTLPLEEDILITYHDEVLTQEFIRDIIKNLKPKERQLFTMRFLYQMSIEEIGTKLNKSRGTVDTSLSRLRKKLLTQLKEHDIEVKEV